MDHFDYTICQEEQSNASDEYEYIVNFKHKHGDELLIDLVRSRPYLYDKTQIKYKDVILKEIAWREIAGILNITVLDCQTRWTRLRQRYSKERALREQETRSGAGKPTRSKWLLFDRLSFLEKHMTYRKSITNMNLSQPSISMMHQPNETINQNDDFRIQEETLSQVTKSSILKQVDNLMPVMVDIPDTQPALVLTSPSSQQSIASTQKSSISPSEESAASSSHQDSDSEILSPPSTCFMGNQKLVKRRKIDPIENAFSQINTTLGTMAMQVCSKKDPTDDDPDVLIGKLVTAELKKTSEPKKSVIKKKFMDILYCSDNL